MTEKSTKTESRSMTEKSTKTESRSMTEKSTKNRKQVNDREVYKKQKVSQ